MLKIINRFVSATAASLFLSTAIFAQSDAAAAAGRTFLPVKAETSFYSATVVFGMQFNDLEVETRDAGDDWAITETARFPNGVVSDTAFVDKKTLRLKRAITREFEKTVEYEIKDGKLTGAETDGKKKPKTFALDTGGADVFNTRAFSFVLYKMLPLAADFETRLKIFNPRDKRIEEINFKVAGEETVATEDGGAFDCYRIDAVATEDRKGKYTVWIERATGRLVKLKGNTGVFKGEVELQSRRRNIRY